MILFWELKLKLTNSFLNFVIEVIQDLLKKDNKILKSKHWDGWKSEKNDYNNSYDFWYERNNVSKFIHVPW